MMVTVATKLDVPIKLLFPRPSSPDAGPDKRRHAMLGLGDIVLPGIVIGLALRFDLYMFYLRRQRRAVVATKETETGTEVEKAAYISVRSRWAELFWAGTGSRSATAQESLRNEALRFEKPYFHATLVGYVAGMICTLLSMHLSGRGQPALLFLVPGVLFALWGKAWRRGELPEAWAFTEAVEEEGQGKEGSQGKDENSGLGFITSFFSPEKQKKQAAKLEKAITKAVDADKSTAEGGSNNTAQGRRPKEILNLSVSFEPSLYKSECSKLE